MGGAGFAKGRVEVQPTTKEVDHHLEVVTVPIAVGPALDGLIRLFNLSAVALVVRWLQKVKAITAPAAPRAPFLRKAPPATALAPGALRRTA